MRYVFEVFEVVYFMTLMDISNSQILTRYANHQTMISVLSVVYTRDYHYFRGYFIIFFQKRW